MRKRKPIILLLLVPFACFGQGPTNQRFLLENSILAGSFGPEMNLFQDTEGDSAHYSLQMTASPGSDPQSLIYSSALWYGGISDPCVRLGVFLSSHARRNGSGIL